MSIKTGLRTIGAALLALALAWAHATGVAEPLASVEVVPASAARLASYEGVVEALRQTTLAAQVPGAVVAIQVKAGDAVKAGQVLLRLDARAAEQLASAAAAQVQAARAAQDAATREFERQQQLFGQGYISQAALDRAQAQHRSAQAQAASQVAAAGAARTESGFYVLKAPYDGVVSDVPAVLGDMAMPGRALLTMHDPAALRVTAAVPHSAAPRPGAGSPGVQVELAGRRIVPLRWQVLPSADPSTHTVELRLELPRETDAVPGAFARVWLPAATAGLPSLAVPLRAVVRRAELTGVYVIGDDGKPLLRQVRLGAPDGERVEVLSGLGAGERVALDPQAAARVK